MLHKLQFFKCDEFAALQLKYLSYSVVVTLLSSPLQPQPDTKGMPYEKRYLDDWWLFINRFNVGSISQMRNKGALAFFIYDFFKEPA